MSMPPILFLLLLIVNIAGAVKSSRRDAARIEACSKNPSLSFCREFLPSEGEVTDKKACSSLAREYSEGCGNRLARRRDEFCAAYENVCYRNKNRDDNESELNRSGRLEEESDENDDKPKHRSRVETEKPSSPKDYIEFCKNYKQRFLYVCPDPVRFGERAAVFCPIYSDRCQIPLPERPILPAAMLGNNATPMKKICVQFNTFATSYCGNSLALQYPNVRDNCDKYQRICNNQNNAFRQQPAVMG